MQMSGYGYRTVAGETWDSVSLRVYGTETMAAEMICANPELTDILVFSGGEMIRLPAVEEKSGAAARTAQTAPWKRNG